jgi:hypothetical protein
MESTGDYINRIIREGIPHPRMWAELNKSTPPQRMEDKKEDRTMSEIILAGTQVPGMPAKMQLNVGAMKKKVWNETHLPPLTMFQSKAKLFECYAALIDKVGKWVNEGDKFFNYVAGQCGFPQYWNFLLTMNEASCAELAVRPMPDIWSAMNKTLEEVPSLFASSMASTLLAHVQGKQMGLFYRLAPDVARYNYHVDLTKSERRETSTQIHTTETKTNESHVHDLIEVHEYHVDSYAMAKPARVSNIIRQIPPWMKDSTKIIDGHMIRDLADVKVASVTQSVVDKPRPVTTFRYDPALVIFDTVVITGWTDDEK